MVVTKVTRKGWRLWPVFFFMTVAALALALVVGGCDNETDTTNVYPDNYLNLGLMGMWQASGETDYGPWTDTYTITAGTISHPDGWPVYADAQIAWVYNFSSTAGCIIIKRQEDSKYNAVYFKDLSATSVRLGDAYDTTKDYDAGEDTSSAVNTLEEAKERFKPENAEKYGGGTKQGGSPQQRQ